MPELRWTLLILGVVFVVALALWERRRPHQASREGMEPRPTGGEPQWGSDVETGGPRATREPALSLPEIRTREPAPPRDLPVVQIPDDAIIGMRVENDGVVAQSHTFDAELENVRSDELPPGHHRDPPQRPAERPQEPAVYSRKAPSGRSGKADESDEEKAEEDEAEAEEMEGDSVDDDNDEAESESDDDADAAAGVGTATAVESPGAAAIAFNVVEPIVEWPPEDQRKLLALRLVASPPERLAGRDVRLALAAEGFLLGKFAIFHKPDANNRAVLSAASLTKPGTFDLQTMDTQRFGGLNLFAVLPGPKSAEKAFEELLMTARSLNERLEGALQDERGGPLTPTRIAALRDSLADEST